VIRGVQMSLTDDPRLYALLTLVARERSLREEKFPDQHLPAGTRQGGDVVAAATAKQATDLAARAGTLTWRLVLEKEASTMRPPPSERMCTSSSA
jgi:hypothetical protein